MAEFEEGFEGTSVDLHKEGFGSVATSWVPEFGYNPYFCGFQGTRRDHGKSAQAK